MLQCPPQPLCQGEMPSIQQISISYYGNSHGPDCGANMAAKGELQQPSCVCLSVCLASHMSDRRSILARASVTFMSLGKPCFVLCMQTVCFLQEEHPGLLILWFRWFYMLTWHLWDVHKDVSRNLVIKLELCCPKIFSLRGSWWSAGLKSMPCSYTEYFHICTNNSVKRTLAKRVYL